MASFNMDFFVNWNRLLSSSRVFLSEKELSEQSVACIILLRFLLGEVESCKPALEVYCCLLGRQESMNNSVGAMAKWRS